MFFGAGARDLGSERSRKEFDQCCAALKKLPLEGLSKDKERSPRGGRGGKRRGQQQQCQDGLSEIPGPWT